MRRETRVPSEAIFLVVGTGIATTARAMTLSFVAIKLQQEFDVGPAMIGFLLGIGSLMGAVAAPLAGASSDKTGRRVVLTSVMIVVAIAMMALAFAETVLFFCAARALAAIGISIFGPISRALISDVCPEPLRLRCFSWRHMASNVGWAVGPLIGIAAGAASSSVFLMAAGIYAALAFTFQFLSSSSTVRENDLSAAEAVSLADSIGAAMRDRRLLHYTGGGACLLAVYGQWTATLAPYLAVRFPDGAEIFAYLVSINGAGVLIGNPIAALRSVRGAAEGPSDGVHILHCQPGRLHRVG
ncbi:MFS transporter [Rhizobium sp. Root1212]|uniref:MFS transporter n=2 Tax=unclassified Rhizobium TaxID=2613769 RepID=UPI000B0BC306|nr:MFS transporter [Rhizobium sp. Root1212]